MNKYDEQLHSFHYKKILEFEKECYIWNSVGKLIVLINKNVFTQSDNCSRYKNN